MAEFDPIRFAPFGIRRESTSDNTSLTLEQRSEIYNTLRRELTVPESPLGKVLVTTNGSDPYILDLNRKTQTSLVALWLSGAQLELASVTVLVSGIVPQDDLASIQVLGDELAIIEHPDFAISEVQACIQKDSRRPLMATAHLYERSYDSVTIQQWSMGLGHAFFDLLSQSGLSGAQGTSAE